MMLHAAKHFHSVSDLRMRFCNHIHSLVTVHVAQEAIMEYWGTHNYCASLPPPYACSTTTAHLRVGNTPATHEFSAHADKCSASTEIRQLTVSEAGGGKCF